MQVRILACGVQEAKIETDNLSLLVSLICTVIGDDTNDSDNYITAMLKSDAIYCRYGIFLITKQVG